MLIWWIYQEFLVVVQIRSIVPCIARWDVSRRILTNPCVLLLVKETIVNQLIIKNVVNNNYHKRICYFAIFFFVCAVVNQIYQSPVKMGHNIFKRSQLIVDGDLVTCLNVGYEVIQFETQVVIAEIRITMRKSTYMYGNGWRLLNFIHFLLSIPQPRSIHLH